MDLSGVQRGAVSHLSVYRYDIASTAASDDTADLSGIKRVAQRGAGSHWGTDDLRDLSAVW